MHVISQRVIAALLLFALAAPASVHADIPEASIRYSIEVQLDPETRDLHGKAVIEWTNTLDEPIVSLPMHLYLNGFSNEATTWQRHTLSARFAQGTILDRFPDPWGWTEPTSIRQGEQELQWMAIAPDDGNHLDRSLIEIELAEPLASGDTVSLQIDWDGRLPSVAARTGGHGDYFMAAQWFPKIAGVNSEGEFNRHQFFGPTEFFANFADYDVQIGVPNGWAVAATGKGELVVTKEDVDWHRYQQKGVVDFAFATGADMVNVATTHELATGGNVEIHIFQPKGFDHQISRWVDAIAAALDTMSTRVMPYPYETVTVVMPPMAGLRSLGMEYPTFFTGGPGGRIWDDSPAASSHINDMIIAHEFAHQYFMGLIASNEFEDAFMDEGMTEYWGAEIMVDRWDEDTAGGEIFGRSLNAYSSTVKSRPITAAYPAVWSGPSFLVRGYSTGRQFYDRPQTTMLTAARLFGQDTVDEIFAAYAKRWSFRHPRVEDFWAVAEEVAGAEVAAMLKESYLHAETPDYKVASIEAKEFQAPRGYVRAEGEVTYVGPERDGDKQHGLSDDAREPGGEVMLEILDPGYTRDVRVMGIIERRLFVPRQTEADEDYTSDSVTFYESNARIEGPDWDHLPVTVRLRFADGTVVEDEWDGKGVYREYRAVRKAPLESVLIDPDYKIRLDIVPVNNGLSRNPKGDIPKSWSHWVAAVYQMLAEGAASWL